MIEEKTAKYCQNISQHNFNGGIHISLQNKYVYFETPKVACSTVKQTLQKIELQKPSAVRDRSIVHNNDYSPLLHPRQVHDINELIQDRKFYKFCFVRNPYSRLLSAYLNKIKRKSLDVSRKKRLLMQLDIGTKDMSDEEISAKEVSFEMFVNAIVAQPAKYMDPHWRIQYYQTLQDFVEFNFIGKLENFQQDLEEVLQKLGVKQPDKYIDNGRWHQTNATERLSEYYTEELRDKVYTKFQKDFDVFNYSSVLPAISSNKAKRLKVDPSLLTKKDLDQIEIGLDQGSVLGKLRSENLQVVNKIQKLEKVVRELKSQREGLIVAINDVKKERFMTHPRKKYNAYKSLLSKAK